MEILFKKLGEEVSFSQLEELWTKLELKSSTTSFFISWHWVSSWLSTIGQEPFILMGYKNDTVVALGIFHVNTVGIWPFKKNVWWLNKTGQQSADQVWIEYNDILFDDSLNETEKSQIRQSPLTQNKSSLQEVHYDLTQFCPDDSLVKTKTTGYITKLQDQDSELDILSIFSKNTRQQIKRSIKLLESRDSLNLVAAQNAEEYFDEICEKHIEQWGDSRWGSGFENPLFCQFHKHLHKNQKTQMLKLEIGGQPIAFGYYFLYKKKVSFYLSAIEKYDDNRIKVGLVFHYMAMNYFQQQGFESYDFLGGDARYKKSMSTSSYTLYSWYLEQKNMFSLLKNTILRIRNKFNQSEEK